MMSRRPRALSAVLVMLCFCFDAVPGAAASCAPASSTTKWRSDPTSTTSQSFLADVDHDRGVAPTGAMRDRPAKLAATTKSIGASPQSGAPTAKQPRRTSGAFPAWRSKLTRGGFSAIPGTSMSALSGVSFITVDGWQGFAATPTAWYSMANGGHNGSSQNKVLAIDFAVDQPRWSIVHPGSPPEKTPSMKQMLGPPRLYYYFDDLPAAAQAYFGVHHIAARNRIIRFVSAARWGDGNTPGDVVDGFRLSDRQFDPPGTFPNVPLKRLIAAGVAKHPVTEDIYVADANAQFAKWTQATNTWTRFTPDGGEHYWIFHGSVIDAERNRWVFPTSAELQTIDLTTNAFSAKPLTAPASYAADWLVEYSGLVHDLDNDRYIVFTTPGTVYAIDPTTAVTTLIARVPAPVNGVNGRVAYFKQLGGIAYLPSFRQEVYFLPTR